MKLDAIKLMNMLAVVNALNIIIIPQVLLSASLSLLLHFRPRPHSMQDATSETLTALAASVCTLNLEIKCSNARAQSYA